MNKRLDLGKEAILPLILKMSWPSIIAMTAMSLYNFIDTFWLARFSSQALAALTVCFPIQLLAAAIGVGTGIGAGSFSARMFGAEKIWKHRKPPGRHFSFHAVRLRKHSFRASFRGFHARLFRRVRRNITSES